MSRAWIAASLVLAAGSLAAAGWAIEEAGVAREDARKAMARTVAAGTAREAALEARIVRLEAAGGGAGSGGAAAPAERTPDGPAGGAPPGPTGPGPAPEPGSPGAPPGTAGPGSLPAPEEGLRAFVRQAVKEELEARRKEGGADPGAQKKPLLSQFAAQLELDDAQREGVHRAVVRGQEEAIALLRTPTAGGRVPVDDLLKAFTEKPEEAQKRVLEVYGMLATEKVPGSEETYAQRYEAVKRSAAEAFRRSFTPEQFKAYEKMGQDPLEIQVEDSPWIEVLQDAWKRQKQ